MVDSVELGSLIASASTCLVALASWLKSHSKNKKEIANVRIDYSSEVQKLKEEQRAIQEQIKTIFVNYNNIVNILDKVQTEMQEQTKILYELKGEKKI